MTPTKSLLLCLCGHWLPIHQMPLRCLRCHRVWLAWRPETPVKKETQ